MAQAGKGEGWSERPSVWLRLLPPWGDAVDVGAGATSAATVPEPPRRSVWLSRCQRLPGASCTRRTGTTLPPRVSPVRRWGPATPCRGWNWFVLGAEALQDDRLSLRETDHQLQLTAHGFDIASERGQ